MFAQGDWEAKKEKGVIEPYKEMGAAMKPRRNKSKSGLRIDIGVRVGVRGREHLGAGKVRWIGEVPGMEEGDWVGIELDDDMGRNDGVVKGVRRFKCKQNRAYFARLSDVDLEETFDKLHQPPDRIARPPPCQCFICAVM
jgi:CAP-Gly domain